jgi:hypothetical protein
VFRGLAEAIYALHTGQTISADAPSTAQAAEVSNDELAKARNWPGYINLDIKLMNVVLAEVLESVHSAYKVPKMIDFGLVCTYNDPSFGDPRLLGTPGWMTPVRFQLFLFVPYNSSMHRSNTRQEQSWNYAPPDAEPVNLKTMTFNMGQVILALLENRQIIYSQADTRGGVLSNNFDHFYSHGLVSLALKCMSWRMQDRPHLYRILYETRMGLERCERHFKGVKRKLESELPAELRMDIWGEPSVNPDEAQSSKRRKEL